MAAQKIYEMAAVYATVLPSLKGMAAELKEQMQQAMPSVQRSLRNGLSNAFSSSAVNFNNLLAGTTRIFGQMGLALTRSLLGSVRSFGSAFKEVFTASAKAAGTAFTASIAAIGGQVVAGGFSRALNLNEAQAKMEALGYSATKMQEIMGAASGAIDGTAYALNESVGAATQFLAAGITGGTELESVLKSTAKLADISGSTFGEMGAIMSKNAAAGIVQWEDMVQLIDRGVPIQSYLAKQMGKTTAEIKKMASAGEITFDMFAKAVNDIQFDSTTYAAKNITLGFRNVRAQLSKIGANLWEPIVDGLGPIFVKVREGLVALQENTGFMDLINRIQTFLAEGMGAIGDFISKIVDGMKGIGGSVSTIDTVIRKFDAFRESLKGLEGPIIGVGLALTSGLISKIPVVGGLFGQISVGAGLLGGVMFQAYNDSAKLQESIGNLVGIVKDFAGSIQIPADKTMFKTLGDSVSGIIDIINSALSNISGSIDFSALFAGIFTNINDFVNTIAQNGGTIVKAIQDLVTGVMDAFSKINSGSDVSIGEWLATTLVQGIQFAASTLQAVVPLVISLISGIVGVATSDFGQTIFGWLVGLAGFLAEHKTVLVALAGTLAAIFIGSKLIASVTAMISFFKAFKGDPSVLDGSNALADMVKGLFGAFNEIITGIGGSFKNIIKTVGEIITSVGELIATIIRSLQPIIKAAGSTLMLIFKTLGSVFTAMVRALAVVGQAVISAAPYLAALGVFILAIGGIAYLLDKMNVFEILGKLGNFVTATLTNVITVLLTSVSGLITVIGDAFNMIGGALQTAWQTVEPVLSWLRDSWIAVVETLGGLLTTALPVLTDSVNSFVTAMGENLVNVIGSVDGLLVTLATNGVAAGIGATAAAGGIMALAAAMLALAGTGALGNIASTTSGLITGFVEDKTGKDFSMINQLTEMARAVAVFNAGVSVMPEQWAAISTTAYTSAYNIMTNFGQGLSDSLISVESRISTEIANMMQRLQEQITNSALNVNINAGTANAANASTNNYNSSTNYNVNVNNSSVVKTMARSAR